MKKELLSLLFLICGISIFGQTVDENVVREFGNNIQNMCSTQDMIYFDRAQKLCNDACRVKDIIMEDFIRNSGVKIDLVQSYLQGFHNARKKGVLNFSLNNVRTIKNSEHVYSSHYGASTSEKDAQRAKKYATIACEIIINGVMNYHVQDLFYVNIREGKIVKITPYDEEIDQRTGKKKVKVDFSDLLYDEQTLGMTYNYGKSWPIGFSINYSYSWFMISADMGFCSSKDKLYKHDLEMTDVMNFKKTDETYTPKFFFTITPSFYMKYFAVGCGTGLLYMKGTQDVVRSFFIEETNAGSHSTTIESSTHDQEKKEKIKFMLRPSLKGFIPISENTFISLAVGYNYAFGYKDKNEVFFGAGIQFNLN